MNAQNLPEQVGIAIERTLAPLLGRTFSAAAVEVRLEARTLYNGAFGHDSDGHVAQPDTLFDLDTLTELFTATAYLRLVDQGRVWLDTPLAVVLPDFAETITFYDLLTHSSGLSPTIDLCALPDYDARIIALLDARPVNQADQRVGYSPLDFLLIGLALETLTDLPLAQAVAALVLQPLDLRAQYAPLPRDGSVAVIGGAGNAERQAHDANACCLDGEAGHAGLFGTVSDLMTLAQLYLVGDNYSRLLTSTLAAEATRAHAADNGFGWTINSGGFGYTRAANGLLWADMAHNLSISVLTDALPDHPENRALLDATWRTLLTELRALVDSSSG